jgi:hypothetical protein
VGAESRAFFAFFRLPLFPLTKNGLPRFYPSALRTCIGRRLALQPRFFLFKQAVNFSNELVQLLRILFNCGLFAKHSPSLFYSHQLIEGPLTLGSFYRADRGPSVQF